MASGRQLLEPEDAGNRWYPLQMSVGGQRHRPGRENRQPFDHALGKHVATVCGALVLSLVAGCAVPRVDTSLQFTVMEGLNLNHFTRDGATAAHLVLRSG